MAKKTAPCINIQHLDFLTLGGNKRSEIKVQFGSSSSNSSLIAELTIPADDSNQPTQKDFNAKEFSNKLAANGFRAATATSKFSPIGCSESWCQSGNWYLPSFTDIEKAQKLGIMGSYVAGDWSLDTYWTAAIKDGNNAWTYSFFSSGAVRYAYNLWYGGSGSSNGTPEIVHTRPIADF